MNAEQKKAYDCVRVRDKTDWPWGVDVLWSLHADGVLSKVEYEMLSLMFCLDCTDEQNQNAVE